MSWEPLGCILGASWSQPPWQKKPVKIKLFRSFGRGVVQKCCILQWFFNISYLNPVLGTSWAHLGSVLEPTPVAEKICKNQGFSLIWETRCSKMLYFTMVFEHFYLNSYLGSLGPSWDRLGSQLPPQKNHQKPMIFHHFRKPTIKNIKKTLVV